jgi:aminoglycoside phosphotransferase (APT) family kinase protein
VNSQTEERIIMAALLRMGLIDADEQPIITHLTGGVSSLIVRVDTRRGTLCVKQALPQLKVETYWSAPLERSHAELAWIKHVSIDLPQAVPTILGSDPTSFCFAMNWLPPERYPVWKLQLRDGVADRVFAADVGRRLAAIHSATADNDALAQSFANDENFFQLRLDPYFGATAKVHADCAASLYELISTTANNKRALVHGDISPKNLLVGPTGPLFLDAECAWYGEPAFDAAFCLCHLLAKCLWRPASSDEFLACFDVFSAAYLQGVRWENPAHIEARITRLLAAIMLARVDGKSPLEYLNELDRERLRHFAKARVLSLRTQLKTIRDEWQRELQK